MSAPKTLYDKIWDDHLVANNEDGTSLIYIDRHLVHEVTSPQAFEGLRLNKRKVRASRAHAGRGRSQRADHRPLAAQSRSRERHPDRDAGREHPRFRHRVLRPLRQAAGHRPHRRPRAGLYPARHDHRLRRQPHLDPRRLRRAGARHRHVRGRARARDPDADPAEGQEHAGDASTGSCRPASPPRTSSSPSSARSAPPAAPATSSSTPAKPSARSRWKAA